MSITAQTSEDLSGELKQLGFGYITPARDSVLGEPSMEFLQDEFAPFLVQSLPRTYIPGSWDCDDFALWAVTQMSLCLAANPDYVNCGHSFLYCSMAIMQEQSLNGVPGPVGHATNIVKCSDGKWYFFEPQNGQIYEVKTALDLKLVADLFMVLL